jgi:hypothetical protein
MALVVLLMVPASVAGTGSGTHLREPRRQNPLPFVRTFLRDMGSVAAWPTALVQMQVTERSMFAMFAMLLLFVASARSAQPAEPAKAIVGYWGCRSGPCFDPEIGFTVDEGERVFQSWLHQRPGASGRWSVEGKTLTVVCCSGQTYKYRIVRVNKRELVLRGEDEKESARYRRIVL